jgi:DNA-binding transcriptional LysR family regulator
VLAGDVFRDPTASRRTVSIMMTDYSAVRLQPAIAHVLTEAPGMSVDVVPLPERPMESERDLITHDFIVAIPGIGIDGHYVPLMDDHYACLVDAANPRVRDGALSFEDFVASPQAVASFGRLHFTPADRRLRELGIERRDPRVTTSGFLPLPSIVAGTDLVAVVPTFLAAMIGPLTGTIGVDPPFGRVDIPLMLWWHESRESDPMHTWVREKLVQATRESRQSR